MHAALFLVIALQPLAAQPDRFGLPACSAPDQELAQRSAFVLCFSTTHKTQLWSAYELKPENLVHNSDRPKRFHHDAQLTTPSAHDSDYLNSSYSRGHMVPAEDMS